MQIKLNNQILDVEEGTPIKELLKKVDFEDAIGARFNNEIKSLNYKLKEPGTLEFINMSDRDGIRIYRKGLLYIIGMAIEELYPNTKVLVHYQLSNSLLCELENIELTEEMLEKIKLKVNEIVSNDYPIEKKSISKEEARKFYEGKETDKGKLQLELTEKKQLSLYWCNEYFNYFYGILPISTGYMKKFEIVKYHRGFLVRYPSRKNIYELQEFKEQKKLLSTLDEYDLLHRGLEVQTLKELNKLTRENKIDEYIELDEALHEKKIANSRTFFIWQNNFCT